MQIMRDMGFGFDCSSMPELTLSRRIGARGEVDGEVCFNTSMTGYQEILTDPSYSGQLVTMTYPLMGNYGLNQEDQESPAAQVAGFVIRESSRIYSSWRGREGLHEYLASRGVVAIEVPLKEA